MFCKEGFEVIKPKFEDLQTHAVKSINLTIKMYVYKLSLMLLTSNAKLQNRKFNLGKLAVKLCSSQSNDINCI